MGNRWNTKNNGVRSIEIELPEQTIALKDIPVPKYKRKSYPIHLDKHYRQRYGITLEQVNALRESQDYKCAICARDENEFTKPLVVDHCHSTLIVRGLLCHSCNTLLGKVKDNPDTLRSAIEYLVSARDRRSTETP